MSQVKTLPKCFDRDEDFIFWLHMDERSIHAKQQTGFVCKDCTPAYKTEMMLQERCEHPEVQFGRLQNGDWGGYIPRPDSDRDYGVYLECNGERRSLYEWSKIRGINYFTLRNRLKRDGWTPEEALGFVERSRGRITNSEKSEVPA